MSIQVTGKNIETGDAFQTYVQDKIGDVLEKYIGPELSGHVRVEKVRGVFNTSCSIRLRTGLLVEAEGSGDDAYASADAAIARLDKRVRRYKRRLKDHHGANGHGNSAHARTFEDFEARDYTVKLHEDEASEPAADEAPVVIAETSRVIRELPVSSAVMQLDLTDHAFLVFRNAASGDLNVVYRRDDGNIGWIAPNAAS